MCEDVVDNTDYGTPVSKCVELRLMCALGVSFVLCVVFWYCVFKYHENIVDWIRTLLNI